MAPFTRRWTADNPLNDDPEDPTQYSEPMTRLEWTLSGPDAGKFNLVVAQTGGNADTGFVTTLTFKSAPNYEAKADADGNNDYEVTVVVTDSAGNKAARDVTVTIDQRGRTRSGEGLAAASPGWDHAGRRGFRS